jgi:peptidyl-prolyl cis-trans isomerase D
MTRVAARIVFYNNACLSEWKRTVVIYHFNRIIRNRFIWGVFVIVIALAFVSVDSCSISPGHDRSTAGSIDGKPILLQTYRTLERYIRQTGRNEVAPPPAMLYTQTWERLASAQVAAQAGIAASPTLVKQEILESGAFTEGFNSDLYRYLLKQNLQLSEQEFEAGLANTITLRMIGAVVGSAAWVSPLEIDDALASYTDTFSVRHAVVSNTFAQADLPLSEQDIARHYEAHRTEYAFPDRVAIRYVAVPISNYVSAVTVSDADILDYYDSNPQRFSRPAGTNETESTTLPLDEARPAIVEALMEEQTADAAFTDVCHVLLEQAITNGIAAVAAAHNLPVLETPLFGAEDFIPQIENAAEFREKAFELDALQAQTRFNAVRGKSVVYLIAAHSNDVARIPDLAEVADRVRAAARVAARNEAFKTRITAAYEAITAAVAAGQTFEKAAHAVNLTATTNYFFSVNAGVPTAIPEINAVIREAVKLRAGGIAASPAPRFGNAVIVTVTDRTPGDPMTSNLLRGQIRSAIEKRIFPPLFGEWSAWNLKQSAFSPTAGTEPAAASTDDADTAE